MSNAPLDGLGALNDPVWGFPLDVADWVSFILGHIPWKLPGETAAAYVARIGPMYPDHSAEEISRWFDSACELPA